MARIPVSFPPPARREYSLPPNFTLEHTPSQLSKKDGYDLNPKDIAATLQTDPNLKDFYDAGTLKEVENVLNPQDTESPHDPYNFSEIPVSSLEASEPPSVGSIAATAATAANVPYPPLPVTDPQTMSTADFIKMMAAHDSEAPVASDIETDLNQELQSTDDYLSELLQKNTINGSAPEKAKDESKIVDFLNKDDVATTEKVPIHLPLSDIVNTELPLVIVSKLTDPRLNLSIEKYIYDNYPDPKNPLNKFARRLFLYKNSNCVVLGKNQNIFRETNLHLASTYSTPILRRFSGGGTVVHDLGNLNFSFICLKEDFSRTAFTTELIKNWNLTLQNRKLANAFELDINEKGDMIRKSDKKKISGSAFQISRGKSLHHGTMLLNSDLHTLGKLIKVDRERLSSICDRATNSIPSPVANTNMDQSTFVELCVDSFVGKFGVPTNLQSKIDKMQMDNLYLVKTHNIEAQLLKIDDLTELPSEVMETYEQLRSWEWTFGKSPRFQMEFTLDSSKINLKFDVNQGRVIGLEFDKDDDDTRLDNLIAALSSKDTIVNFSGPGIGRFILDPALKKELAWRIDQCANYERMGITH